MAHKGLTGGRGILLSFLTPVTFRPPRWFSIFAPSHRAFSVFLVLFPCPPSPKLPSTAITGQCKLKSISPTVLDYFCCVFQISLFTTISQAQFSLVYLFSILPLRCFQHLCSCYAKTDPSSFLPSDFSTSLRVFFTLSLLPLF